MLERRSDRTDIHELVIPAPREKSPFLGEFENLQKTHWHPEEGWLSLGPYTKELHPAGAEAQFVAILAAQTLHLTAFAQESLARARNQPKSEFDECRLCGLEAPDIPHTVLSTALLEIIVDETLTPEDRAQRFAALRNAHFDPEEQRWYSLRLEYDTVIPDDGWSGADGESEMGVEIDEDAPLLERRHEVLTADLAAILVEHTIDPAAAKAHLDALRELEYTADHVWGKTRFTWDTSATAFATFVETRVDPAQGRDAYERFRYQLSGVVEANLDLETQLLDLLIRAELERQERSSADDALAAVPEILSF